MNKLHQRLREARTLTGLTQQALATELGVTRSSVSNWESPTGTTPVMPRLVGLARLSGLRVEYLASGRGPRLHGPSLPACEEPAHYAGLDSQEQALLERFRAMTPDQRDDLLVMVTALTSHRRRRR